MSRWQPIITLCASTDRFSMFPNTWNIRFQCFLTKLIPSKSSTGTQSEPRDRLNSVDNDCHLCDQCISCINKRDFPVTEILVTVGTAIQLSVLRVQQHWVCVWLQCSSGVTHIMWWPPHLLVKTSLGLSTARVASHCSFLRTTACFSH